MALRGVAGQVNTATANTCVITHGISIQAGDIVLLVAMTGGSTTATLTSTGFTAATSALQGNGGATFQVLMKTAGAGEPASYTVNNSVTDFMAVHARVYSGRSGVVTTQAAVGFSSSATPFTFPAQVIVPAANDDVVFLGAIPAAGNLGTVAYTPGAGFANGNAYTSAASSFTTGVLGSDFVNNAGGSASFPGGSFTYTTGSAGAMGFLISLAAGAAAPTSIPSSLGFFGAGPGPRGPFNNNQFRSFAFSTSLLSANTYSALLTEAGTAADAASSVYTAVVTLTESGAATDTVTAANVMAAALAEAGAAADSLVAVATYVASRTESGAALDALTAALQAVASIAEAGSALDAYASTWSTTAALTESGTAADSLSSGNNYIASLAESAAASDALNAVLTAVNALSAAASAADALSSVATLRSAVSEAGSAADGLTGSAVMSLALSESGSAADSFVPSYVFRSLLTEVGTAIDGLATHAAFLSALNESGTANAGVTGFLSLNAPHYLVIAAYQPRLITISPRFTMQAGPLPYAEFYMRVGEINSFGIDWSNWLSSRWVEGAFVAAGFAIRPSAPNGYQFACTVPGESGEPEPRWPTYPGATITDGSVQWICQAVDTTSLATTVASATWTVPAGVLAVSQTLVGQITSTYLDVTNATAGQDYFVSCSATMADGEVKVGRFKLKVR